MFILDFNEKAGVRVAIALDLLGKGTFMARRKIK